MQESKKWLGVFVILSGMILACNSSLPAKDYIRWVRDIRNGLHKQKQVGEYVFDIQYKPSEYSSLTERAISDSSNKQSDMVYLTLKLKVQQEGKPTDILRYKLGSEKEYYDRLYYYSFRFVNDLYLLNGDEKIPCSVFHFERSYDLSAYRTWIIGFYTHLKENDLILVIDSPQMDTGPVRIRWNRTDLLSVPELEN